MEAIREWINGARSYDQGAALYLRYGKDKALRKIFAEPASDFKKRKLIEALKSMLSSSRQVDTEVQATKEAVIARNGFAEKKWPEDRDEMLGALHAKWKPLFAEMMSLCARLYDVAKAGEIDSGMKAEAGRMTHRILSLDDSCDRIYEERDYYLKHNKLPEQKKPMELAVDPMKIPLALSNATRYIRYYRNKLKKDPSNIHAAAQLKKYEWVVAEYKKMLNL